MIRSNYDKQCPELTFNVGGNKYQLEVIQNNHSEIIYIKKCNHNSSILDSHNNIIFTREFILPRYRTGKEIKQIMRTLPEVKRLYRKIKKSPESFIENILMEEAL